MLRMIRSIVLLLMAQTLMACSAQWLKAPEPWIKPYERNNLADPLMAVDRDPVAGTYMHHVYQAREGARGAEGGAGGGCGCN